MVRIYFYSLIIITAGIYVPAVFHFSRHKVLILIKKYSTLSEILGHKNPAITLKRYAHSMLEHKTEMNRLGKLLL